MRFVAKLLWALQVVTFLVIIAGLAAYAPVARDYAKAHVHVVDNKQTIAVTTFPGEVLNLGVRMPDAVSGLWAAPRGLDLKMGDQTFLLMDPKPQTWGDEITTNLRDISDDKTATGRYIVPTVTTETVMEGRISGTVVHPVGGLGTFSDETTIVDVPVKLTVKPAADQGWTSTRKLTSLVNGVLIAAAVLAGLAVLSIVSYSVIRGASAWKDVPASLIGALFLTAIFVGALFLGEALATPDVSDVDVLGALPVTPAEFIACLGGAAFLAMIGISMSPGPAGPVHPAPPATPPAPAS